jgi:hypothetical protein
MIGASGAATEVVAGVEGVPLTIVGMGVEELPMFED